MLIDTHWPLVTQTEYSSTVVQWRLQIVIKSHNFDFVVHYGDGIILYKSSISSHLVDSIFVGTQYHCVARTLKMTSYGPATKNVSDCVIT